MFRHVSRSRNSQTTPGLGIVQRDPARQATGPTPEAGMGETLNDSAPVSSLLQMRRALNPPRRGTPLNGSDAPIQAKAKIVTSPGERASQENIWERLETFIAAQELAPIDRSAFDTALVRIATSPIDYGEINLSDDNHLIQLYHNITKQLPENRDKKHSIDRQERRASFDEDLDSGLHKAFQKVGLESYMTVFIGSGASVAYAISAMGSGFDPRTAAVIGPREQPWAGKRGPGVVAHPSHQITPNRRYAGGTAVGDTWQERGAFSDDVAAVVNSIHHITGSVTAIEKYNTFSSITVAGHRGSIQARRIIFGAGSGDHKVPEGTAPEHVAHAGDAVGPGRRIMSMDIFTQVAGDLWKDAGTLRNNAEGQEKPKSNITVVLSGANGGIDVAYDALRRGYKVEFIVSSGASFLTGFPNYAAYAPYIKGALKSLQNLRKSVVGDIAKNTGENIGEVIAKNKMIEAIDNKTNEIIKSVEAAGFDPKAQAALYHGQHPSVAKDAEKAFTGKFEKVYFGRAGAPVAGPGGIIVEVKDLDGKTVQVRGDIFVYAIGQDPDPATNPVFKVLEPLKAKLKPLLDVDKRFNDSGNTVIGLGTDDGMISIVGATAFRYGAGARIAGATGGAGGMGPQSPVGLSLPGNVLINDQLTPSRSQIEAQQGFLPLDIGNFANFVTDDRTALAVHISAKYPALADYKGGRYIGEIVQLIIANRKTADLPELAIADESGAGELGTITASGKLPVPPHGKVFQDYWTNTLNDANQAIEAHLG